MGAFLCGAGTKGRRYALPNARLLMQKTGFEEQVRRTCLVVDSLALGGMDRGGRGWLTGPWVDLTTTSNPANNNQRWQVYGQASDIVLEVESTMKENMRFLKELSDITGRSEAQIREDFKCVLID